MYNNVPNNSFLGLFLCSPNSIPLCTTLQVFHVCAFTDDGLIMKSFLCPESTLFDQSILKCNWWFYVDCKSSKKLYDSNIPISKSYQLMKALSFFSSYKKQRWSAIFNWLVIGKFLKSPQTLIQFHGPIHALEPKFIMSLEKVPQSTKVKVLCAIIRFRYLIN